MLDAIIKSDYKKHLKLFELEQIAESSIVLLGDSIIKYWPYQDFYLNNNIINRGIPGDTSQGVLDRLDQIIKIKPQAVILNVGSNDLVREEKNHPNNIVKRILAIKYALETSVNDIKVYIVSIPPVLRDHVITNKNYMKTRTNEMIDEINDQLRIYTNIIDVNSCLKDDNNNLKLEYTTDGLHFTELGYRVFSQIIASETPTLTLR